MPEPGTLSSVYAPGEVSAYVAAAELVGPSAAIARVEALVRRVASCDDACLLTARRGADAESVARDIHVRSARAAMPFVAVVCGAPGVERALFGEPEVDAPLDLEALASGSRIAAARGGTLFLEDITELPAAAQSRLARLARDCEARINGVRVRLDLRLIASAVPGIETEVRAHRFRSDVFRRLSAVRIDLPPLSERIDDLPALAARVLDDFCAAQGSARRTFTPAALALIGGMSWPGNLAELREAVERAAASTPAAVIPVEALLPSLRLERTPPAFAPEGTLREARLRFEHDYIAAVLEHHGWRMADAAQTLGIQRPNLYRKARQLGIPLTRAAE
jgi:two-component system nitrogen regulation response regulator NtrX